MKDSEIQENYHWDLSHLFANDEEWEMAFKTTRDKAISLKEFKGQLLESPEKLYQAIQNREEVFQMLENVLVYANLKRDENTKNPIYQGIASRAEKLWTEIEEIGAFFIPEILSAEYDIVKKMLTYPDLKIYEQFFEDLFRRKEHTLSEEMESVLAKAGELGGIPSNTYSMLLNADMTFEDAIDSKGKAHKLTNASYIPLLMSSDRKLRQDAFEKYYKVYGGHINTIASLMQGEVDKNIFFSKMRQHPSPREAALFENNIPNTVPDQLIEAVNNNLDVFYKYMRLRKKVLGLEELHLYDIYTPIIPDVDFDISYDEAKNMVIDSLKVLGKDYQDIIRSAFDERWIHVYETEGKRSGAYSSGTYDSKPYILLNHKDNLDSMFTLTHELGHSIHSYLTWKNQPYVYGDYSIFVAEVASTTNEAILNDYLIKNIDDQEKKKYILNHYLEQFRGTVFRQTMFAEFERDIHDHVEKGQALTAEFLCDHYLSLNKKYFGPDVVIDDDIKYEWSRIPHMYYNFYVYQYATGFSAAIALSNRILKEGESAVKDYIEFLSSGSKNYPINVLRKAGVDMETETPVNNALSVFKSAVDELESLLI